MNLSYLLIAFVLGFLVAFNATKETDRDWYFDELAKWDEERPVSVANSTTVTEFVAIDGEQIRHDINGGFLKVGESLQWQARNGIWISVPSDRYRILRQVRVP